MFADETSCFSGTSCEIQSYFSFYSPGNEPEHCLERAVVQVRATNLVVVRKSKGNVILSAKREESRGREPATESVGILHPLEAGSE